VTTYLALVGPTASGKTALSLAVARRLDAEIISMDSRQVYRGMDIGTAKVTEAERSGVPHHGLGLVDPDERYSAGRFARDARRWIEEIRARGRVPLLVGGTGFFLRALREPIFAEPELDPVRLEALRTYLRDRPREELAAWVRRLDPERAELAVEGGPQRMSRTLEVALLSGKPLSRWHRDAPREAPPRPGVVVCLEIPRAVLAERVDLRTRRMVEAGFVEEVRGLLDRGYGPGAPGMTGTGYREVARHLLGEASLAEAVEEVARRTRQYARRQATWFRHQLPDDTVRIDATAPFDTQVEKVLDAWSGATQVMEEDG
jgi:tRNA dimethylallyltransferase